MKKIYVIITDKKEFEIYLKRDNANKNRDEKRNAGIKCDVYIVSVYEDEIYVPMKRNNRWIIYNRPKHEVMFDGFGYEFCNKLSKVLNDISHHRIDVDE